MTPGTTRFIAAVIAAQVMVQIGAFTLPALLPQFIDRWALSNTEAGWLVGVFFAAYVATVPVLVALTDRIPTRVVYLIGAGCTAIGHFGLALWADGFWSALALRAIAGIGWAGAYMPGLKAIADPLVGQAQSRAVSWHAAGVGIAGTASFAVAWLLEARAGANAAFLFGAFAACTAAVIALAVMPARLPPRAAAAPHGAPPAGALLDFRPVLRNRQAMAWIIGYAAHTWELAALRAWGVTFLAAAMARDDAPAWLPHPALLFTLVGLVGIAVSITGNETAQRHGRARVALAAMLAAAGFSVLTGAALGVSAILAAVMVLLWNAAIYLDSSALTAGTVQAADPARRGATMGLHSMAGYAGGFLGPLGVGLMLDLAGNGPLGWALAFGHLAVVTLAGLWLMRHFAPRA